VLFDGNVIVTFEAADRTRRVMAIAPNDSFALQQDPAMAERPVRAALTAGVPHLVSKAADPARHWVPPVGH